MDYQTALDLLKIESHDLSEENINSAFKKNVPENHPDGEGNDETMIALSEAREFLLQSLSQNNQPAIPDAAYELALNVSAIIAKQRGAEKQAESLKNDALFKATNKLHNLKNKACISSAAAAAVTYFAKDVGQEVAGLLEFFSRQSMLEVGLIGLYMRFACAIMVCLFAMRAFKCNQEIKKVEYRINEFCETLIIKSTFIDAIVAIFDGRIPKNWTFREMCMAMNTARVYELDDLINYIGTEKLCRLLIAKGQEYGFIDTRDGTSKNNYLEIYSIRE